MLDAIDRVEGIAQSARGQHPPGIGCGAVRVDNAPAGQTLDLGDQRGLMFQMIQRNVMDVIQVGRGIRVVFTHQSGQRRAVCVPVMPAQTVGFGLVRTGHGHDIGGHAHFDLIEQPGSGGIKRVVQIEDPGIDMREVIFQHALRVARARVAFNAGVDRAQARTVGRADP